MTCYFFRKDSDVYKPEVNNDEMFESVNNEEFIFDSDLFENFQLIRAQEEENFTHVLHVAFALVMFYSFVAKIAQYFLF